MPDAENAKITQKTQKNSILSIESIRSRRVIGAICYSF